MNRYNFLIVSMVIWENNGQICISGVYTILKVKKCLKQFQLVLITMLDNLSCVLRAIMTRYHFQEAMWVV